MIDSAHRLAILHISPTHWLASIFLSVARHCIVTRNAGAPITYLVQYLLNKSREPGLQRIRTLTLPLGQDLPCEVVDVGEK